MKAVTRILPFVVIAFLAGGCGHGGGVGGLGTDTSSISLDQEWQLGDQIAAQVAQQVHFVNNPTAVAYVTSVGERIHAVTPLAGRPFHFYIVNDPEVNAFSIPGGHVYVNSGLLAQADRADELAAVLAHEESHIVARHVLKQMQQQQEINALGSILLGQNPGALQSILANVLAGGVMARFSRADEKQADDMGLQFMYDANFNPQGMLDFFQKLLALDSSHPGAVSRFFQDHPGTQDRINDIQSRLATLPPKPGAVTDEPEFHNMKSALGM